MDENTEKTNTSSTHQWMEDVNETLDMLTDDVQGLQNKVKQALLVGAAAAALAGIEGLGLATLFKGQKAIVETLQQIVAQISPPPPTPEEQAHYDRLMANARYGKQEPTVVSDNHKGEVADPRIVTNTETMAEAAEPVATPATEAPDWARHAMANDPSWAEVTPEDLQ